MLDQACNVETYIETAKDGRGWNESSLGHNVIQSTARLNLIVHEANGRRSHEQETISARNAFELTKEKSRAIILQASSPRQPRTRWPRTQRTLAKRTAETSAMPWRSQTAVSALLILLGLLRDPSHIIGQIAEIAESSIIAGIIKGCVKSVEMDGKAEFKAFEKRHTLSMDQPSDKPTRQRPPATSQKPPKTSTQSIVCNLQANGLVQSAPYIIVTSFTDTKPVSEYCRGVQWVALVNNWTSKMHMIKVSTQSLVRSMLDHDSSYPRAHKCENDHT